MPRSAPKPPSISLKGCRQHNLKGFDLEIPLGKLTVVTGPSGSGKSSLAFHTLYAEGQRRYVETFSPYVRQFFDRMDKPAVDSIHGIPPAIAIEQKNHVRTTRSTVGTLTEINDYLKLLFPRLATAFDPKTGEEIRPDTPESAATWALETLGNQPVLITFPILVPAGTKIDELSPFLNAQGYLRLLLPDGSIHRTDAPWNADFSLPETIQVVQDRVTLNKKSAPRLREALETAFHLGKGHATISSPENSKINTENSRVFSTAWHNPRTGFTLRPPTPSLFSFNSPLGACPACRGFGRVIGIDLEKAVPDPTLTLKQGAIKPFQGERGDECQRDLIRNCRERGIDINTPWEDLEENTREWIHYGDSPHTTDLEALEELWQSGQWYGVKGFFDWMETKAYKMHVRIFLSRYRSYTTCATCRGKRLQPEALCFKIDGKSLPDLWSLPIDELLPWAENQKSKLKTQKSSLNPDHTLDLVLTEITSRLGYLEQVGLGYLTLDRPTRTLSGGEIERVNLTTCLGASLTGTLFVLDEPTVGLHPRDIDRLVAVMHGLRDKGNTLVVVEHEHAVMRAADHLIDIGPDAGSHGGEIVYQGAADQFASVQCSVFSKKKPKRGASFLKTEDLKLANSTGTIPWLTGQKSIPIPEKRRKPGKAVLQVRGATRHNLRKLDVDIPLGLFVCLTGVSGSGKSTLAHDVIYQNVARQLGIPADGDPASIKSLTGSQRLDGVELVDQSPAARTPRSTPAVLLGAFDPIRQLFCEADAAKSEALKPGFFSFNSGDGRCDRCAGNGFEKVEMQFLSDLYVTCPDCEGSRYKPSTLEYHYNGKSIAEILNLTANDVADVFNHQDHHSKKEQRLITQIQTALAPLIDVGLGYLKLGQPLNTLSGGESQRLKLCQLLASSSSSFKTQNSKLLILDEPTTGLHFSDIQTLLNVFRKLVDAGHSLLVIEHNLDVIKSADWILDLGPEAGKHGGQLTAQGPPEHIALQDSPTAHYLKQALSGARPPVRPKAKPSLISNIQSQISLRGARHHNLKNISLDIPRDQLVVISGLSGSGKSTLAFDILFAEGQRRFLDSMSAYARQFADQLEKPEIDQLQGLPPTVAIEQRISQGGVKSTVATVTELWNFIRLLYSKLGTIHCPACQLPVEKQSIAAIEQTILGHLKRGPVTLLAPVIRGKKGYHTEVAQWALKQGFTRLLVDKQFKDAESFTRLERFKEHDIDVVVAELQKSKITNHQSSINRALEIGKGLIRILTPEKKFILLSTNAACPSCNTSFDDLDPRLFSFNSPHGWCPECRGHGRVPKRRQHLDTARFDSVLEAELDADRAISRMDQEELIQCPSCQGSRLNPVAANVRLQGAWASRPPTKAKSAAAGGSGWGVSPQAVAGASRSGLPIATLAHFTIHEATTHFRALTFPDARQKLISRDILPEIHQRLDFLREVGLGYLQLDRSGNTLSGGESQRIRLAAQLGSNLRGVLYVLDEPTIGLHPRDNAALLKTLTALRDHGNSLVIVEHDEDTIAAADHLIDLGPGAGRLGGEVVYQGKPPQVISDQCRVISGMKKKSAKPPLITDHCSLITSSPTLRAFASPLSHPTRGARRDIKKDHAFLRLTGCHANNLKHIDAAIPLARLTVLTGISGSGKSTLMHQCVAQVFNRQAKTKPYQKATGEKAIKACYEVDQSPIGKTSRSCPATYVKVFDHIRALFAQLPEARMRGFDASRFSFNTEGGRCPDCKGNGRVKLEMDFLPSTWVHCETCNGDRYNPATLDVTLREKHIGHVLAMTIDEAAAFFDSHPRIAAPLQLMADTGLGYLQLGQPSPTLSGGEAQRIKLVSELIKGRGAKARMTNRQFQISNLYLIEEPTVGLHHEDIRRLIDILHRLVDEGHTVVVIEHHMAVAAEADWILDLGPEAGDGGGKIIAQGAPEKVAKSKRSRTAPFLAIALHA